MQKFLTRSLFLILLLSVAESWALPPCPGSYDNNTWTNCEGTSVGPYGYSEYVGEWKGANATVKALMPGPMGINTSVNLRMMTYTVLTEDGKPAINQGFVCYA